MKPHEDQAPIRVLVLEDSPIILMDLENTLEDAGFEPVCARNCAKALQAIETTPPDVAILDVNLEVETCEAVARELRSLQIPFILHTGDLERQNELVTRLDAPILAKPAFSDMIVQVVRNLYRRTDITGYST